MFDKIIKDYFTFTKKERVAVITLVILTVVIFVLPYLIPQKKISINKEENEQIKLELAKLKPSKKDAGWNTYENHSQDYVLSDGHHRTHSNISDGEKYLNKRNELFYFDPNTLQAEDWERLGLSNKTIATIQKYISKGGRFRIPEDIGKIYGLKKNEFERLKSFVKIQGIADNGRNLYKESVRRPKQFSPDFISSPVDINTADSTVLIALPGIGSKLAARIIHFREKLGGFYAVEQLADLYGLPDSAFQKIRPLVTVSVAKLRMLNINTADISELKQHPYLKWNVANTIVEYRNQHGNFKNLEELLEIENITPILFKKISPYLNID